ERQLVGFRLRVGEVGGAALPGGGAERIRHPDLVARRPWRGGLRRSGNWANQRRGNDGKGAKDAVHDVPPSTPPVGEAGRGLRGKISTLLARRLARGDPNSGEHGEETDDEVDPDRLTQCERTHGRGEHGIDRHGDGGSRRRRTLEREHPEEKGG